MHFLKKIFYLITLLMGYFFSYLIAVDLHSPPSEFELRLKKLSAISEEATRLHNLFTLYWDWCLYKDPTEATFLGYPGEHGKWPDLSQQAVNHYHQFSVQLLESLDSIHWNLLTEEDQISYLILKRTLEEEIKKFEFNEHFLLMDQMQGIHLNVALVLDLMPTSTIEDYEYILARLRQLPKLLMQVKQSLEKGIKTGITPPQIAMKSVPQQILNQMPIQPFESPLLKAFLHIPSSIEISKQQDLQEEAKHIYSQTLLPALQEFYLYITKEYIPHCRQSIAFSDLPRGQDWYAHKVYCTTTTELSPQQIHEIGIIEVQRIYQEMLMTIAKTPFKGNFAEFLQFLKTDPQFFYSNRDDLLKGYQNLTHQIETKLPLLFSKLPTLPFEVVPVPNYSEESQIAAYYCQGSPSHHRPGYFFINISYPEQRPKWEMEPLALHESIPGHHLQISLAQELDHLPDFRKNTHFTAYVEGWGLYAESLGSDLGLYQDSYAYFGKLTYEMLRAIRLVVDTGIHAMGWSREQAIDFFKQYVGMSDHEMITEVDRYLVMPSQALAYKIGELKIKTMRQWSMKTLGDKFNLQSFHGAWLKYGTIPLDIAEKCIYQWANETLPLSLVNQLENTLK